MWGFGYFGVFLFVCFKKYMKKENHIYLESEEFHKPNFIHVSTRPKFCACLLIRYILELADFRLGSRGYGKVLTVA